MDAKVRARWKAICSAGFNQLLMAPSPDKLFACTTYVPSLFLRKRDMSTHSCTTTFPHYDTKCVTTSSGQHHLWMAGFKFKFKFNLCQLINTVNNITQKHWLDKWPTKIGFGWPFYKFIDPTVSYSKITPPLSKITMLAMLIF